MENLDNYLMSYEVHSNHKKLLHYLRCLQQFTFPIIVYISTIDYDLLLLVDLKIEVYPLKISALLSVLFFI